MLYFAYGANLDASQMRLRCAGARGVGKARLDDYRFCFPLWSRIRQSGLISIEPAAYFFPARPPMGVMEFTLCSRRALTKQNRSRRKTPITCRAYAQWKF